jgi:hypothetical protein
MALLLSILLAAVGTVCRIWRLWGYAALIILVFLAADYLGSAIAAPFILSGLVVLSAGLIMLIRFIKKYPASGEAFPGGIRE